MDSGISSACFRVDRSREDGIGHAPVAQHPVLVMAWKSNIPAANPSHTSRICQDPMIKNKPDIRRIQRMVCQLLNNTCFILLNVFDCVSSSSSRHCILPENLLA
mgnify:FL=1